jgi:hypothetical protein
MITLIFTSWSGTSEPPAVITVPTKPEEPQVVRKTNLRLIHGGRS